MLNQVTSKTKEAAAEESCCAPSCCGGGDAVEAAAQLPQEPEQVTASVRERYGRIASGDEQGCGCASGSQALGYSAEALGSVPDGADLSLGCGAPIEALGLKPGESVLDLGSGAGLDAFLAARQVGSQGRVIGVDMTPEMLAKARANAVRDGYSQVEFREGRLEKLPVEDASIDAVTSNCVINLVPDKAVVFREIARVLRPGGRLVISDVVLASRLPEPVEKSLLAWVGCVSGAQLRERYFAELGAAGLSDVEVLHDSDFLKKMGGVLPPEVDQLLAAGGLSAADLDGLVRSVTYRAVKSA